MPVSSQSGAGNTVEDGTGNENNAPECMSSECQEMLHRRGLLTLKLSDTADHLDCCHSTDRLTSLSSFLHFCGSGIREHPKLFRTPTYFLNC